MNGNQNGAIKRAVIGLIPAAGQGTRLAPLPCSKELYPIGFKTESQVHRAHPKVVCQYLLELMRLAGISNVYIVLREGKWDIPAYLGDGSNLGLNLAYLMMRLPFGVPYTLDQAYPFVRDAIIAFGFPDIVYESDDAFVQLVTRHLTGEIDAVLGLFPANRPKQMDIVDLDDQGRITRLFIRPTKIHLRYTWGIAVWTPGFTRFMHEYLASIRESAEEQGELFLGEVFNAAIQEGLKIEGVLISDKPYLDIGTGDDLVKAVKRGMAQVE